MDFRGAHLLLLVLAACGPSVPDDGASTTSTSGAAPTTGAESMTTSSSSSGDIPPDPSTVGSDATGPTTSASGPDTASDATTGDPGPCVIDPMQGICSAACNISDCCACEGRSFKLDPDAPSCTLAMGIVTDVCPWRPHRLNADGVELPDPFACETPTGWTLFDSEGDVWIELCVDTCAQFLAGEIVELTADIFCEAA